MSRAREHRLRRLEAHLRQEAPSVVVSDRPLQEGEAARLLANWQEEVAADRASVTGRALIVRSPRLTVAEWCELYGGKRQE